MVKHLINAFGDIVSFDDVEEDILKRSLHHVPAAERLPGFADLPGLWSSWLPLPGSQINVVDNPFAIPVVSMGEVPDSRVVWRWLLKQRQVTGSNQYQELIKIYDHWETLRSDVFYNDHRIASYAPDQEARSHAKSIFDETTKYFQQGLHADCFYHRLVFSHIKVNMHSMRQAEENIRNGHASSRGSIPIPRRNGPFRGSPSFTERAYVYAENLPQVLATMKQVGPDLYSDSHIEEAWWTLMLRMQAWNMGIKMVTREGAAVPSQFYNSPSRVYIL